MAAPRPHTPMVDFLLSEEVRRVQEEARRITTTVIAPHAARYDREGSFPQEAVAALTASGFMSMAIPRRYGGSEQSNVAMSAMLIEVNKHCPSTGVICSVHNSLVSYPIVRFAAEAVKERYLPKLARVEWLGAYCLTEPEAGSDAANQRTTAVRDGDAYVLNGTKIFVTTGKEAQLFIVFARTRQEADRAEGISCFVVERDSPGLTVGKSETKMGITASSTVEVHFQDCRVPAANLLGEEGKGFKIAMEVLNGGRIGIACQAAGIMAGLLEEVSTFAARERRNGKPLFYDQHVSFRLAQMAAEYDAACLLIYRAAWARDRHPNPIRECSAAKLFAAQAANRAAREALQILGIHGLRRGNRVERFYRDARITEIYEGTSEVQKLVLSRVLAPEKAR